MKYYKKDDKTCHIGVNKTNNTVILATSKAAIAKFIGISVDTLNRKLANTPSYADDKYSVWCNVRIRRIKRGFAL
jgi:hypothetical protein